MPARHEPLSISIITPAYNNPEEVARLLESICPEIAKDRMLEVIVVDDCSPGDSIKKVAASSGFAEYMRLDKNSGPAEARNVGAKAAKNEILVFVDSDIILSHDTISRIRDKFAGDESVAVFGGEYDLEPVNVSFSTKFKSLMVRSWSPRENVVTVFLTRLGAIKKQIFEEMGGFDTSLKTASVEDYELGRRLISKGYTIYYDSSITVKHHFPNFKKQIGLFFHRAFMWIYVFKKHGKFDNTCTTPILAMAQVFGFSVFLFLFLAIINSGFIYVSFTFALLFIISNLRFFKLTLENEGIVFTIKSIPLALILSFFTFLGGVSGVFYYFIYNKIHGKRLAL